MASRRPLGENRRSSVRPSVRRAARTASGAWSGSCSATSVTLVAMPGELYGRDSGGGSPWVWLRVALVAFVLAWMLGPSALRDVPSPAPDRGPQPIDRDRYGFDSDDEDEDEELAHAPELAPRTTALRRFALGIAVIGALVAVVWFVESRTGWSSLSGEARAEAVERFSAEASRIAGKPVEIRCDEARDYVGAIQHADGVATVGGELAILTPEICHDLYRLAFAGDVTGSRTGRALAVLAHEAW